MKGEQVLEKGEFEGFLRSLQSVVGRRDREGVQRLAQHEIRQYQGRAGKGAFLKLFGDLLKCMESQESICLRLKSGEGRDLVRIFPMDIEYQSPEFYLLGYLEDGELAAFALDAIASFQVSMGKQGSSFALGYSDKEGRQLLEKIQKERRREAHEED